jgi:hypothetical protein
MQPQGLTSTVPSARRKSGWDNDGVGDVRVRLGWWRGLVATLIILGTGLGPIVGVASALGMASVQTATLSLTAKGPTTGTVGAFFSVSFTASGGFPPYSHWTASGSFPPGVAFSVNGTATAHASGTPTAAGNFLIVVSVDDVASADGGRPAVARFPVTIDPAPPPTIPPTLPPTLPPTVPPTTATTVPATVTPTTRPAHPTTPIVPTTPPAATLPGATLPATTLPATTGGTAPPPTDVVTGTTTMTFSPPGLVLSQPSIEPGGQLVVHGSGCQSGSLVRLSVGDAVVATVTADGGGTFTTPIAIPDLPLGQVDVVAACGPTLASPLNLAVSTSVDAGTGVLGLFFFFLLLSLMLFRRRQLARPTRKGPDELT